MNFLINDHLVNLNELASHPKVTEYIEQTSNGPIVRRKIELTPIMNTTLDQFLFKIGSNISTFTIAANVYSVRFERKNGNQLIYSVV